MSLKYEPASEPLHLPVKLTWVVVAGLSRKSKKDCVIQ